MKKTILLLLTMLTFSVSNAQLEELNEVPQELIGVWKSFENEFLRIGLRGNFQRVDGVTRTVVSSGTIVVEDNRIKVYRQDINDEYELGYFINEQTFVVSKPGEPNRAWLFYKVN